MGRMVKGKNASAFEWASSRHRGAAPISGYRQKWLLSAAAIALLATPSFASSSSSSDDVEVSKDDICVTGVTCITSKKESAFKTSAKGNIYVFYDDDNGDGEIIVKKDNTALVTIDSDNYFYSKGYLANTGHSGAVGVKIDLSSDRDVSAIRTTDSDGNALDYEFENYEEDYITGAAVYLDDGSYIYLTGDGSDKVGIWLDPGSGTGSLTGDIITYSSSVISIKGDDSYGVRIDSGATLIGNIELNGSLSVYQHTAKSQSYSGVFGLFMNGYVDGSVGLYDGGTVLVSGQGSQGFFITGSGVSGNITIAGTLETEGIDSSSMSSSYTYYYSGSTKTKTYPEAGTALTLNSSIAKGVEITGLNYDDDSSSTTGSVISYGEGTAVLISPVATAGKTTYTATSSVVIGLYQSYDPTSETFDSDGNLIYTYEQYDPGFGFYNRGSITISPTNANHSVTAAMEVLGTAALPTYIDGGIFSSGSMSASASTDSDHKSTSVSATGLLIGDYTYVGGYYDTTTGIYYEDDISCTGGVCTYTSGIPSTVVDSDGDVITKSSDDAASLVNSGSTGSGTISATVSGYGTGTATAILISANARVTSLINSGTITATATTSKTSNTQPLVAYGIRDLSGTLTYIKNSGTITATATELDDEDRATAYAIDLSAVTEGMDAYDGVTIVDAATSDSKAIITGDILFGEGSNQQIYVYGAGSSYYASISGNISYGYCGSSTCTSNDLFSVGAFGYFTGAITAESGVAIEVANNGILYLENDDDSGYLNATDVTVEDGGLISIGVKIDSGLNETGVIQSSGTVDIKSGASLGVAFNSYLTSGDYVLIRSTSNDMTIEDLATYSHDISTPMTAYGDGEMPFLFKSADLVLNYYTAAGVQVSSASEAGTGGYSQLVLEVETKSADELGLTGYAKQIFGYANKAVATDDDLGAAMVNGIHANVTDTTGTEASIEAQRAYDSFAPNVTGGTRAIAVEITDQATGVVGARQRSLQMFGKTDGDYTLWGQEFVQSLKNPGQGAVQEDGSREKNGFKDHGFGVVLGMDAGSPTDGWYGGALTFYNGDVNEIGRTSHENQLWFIATGYSAWRGKGLFLDTKVDLGYAHIKGLRAISLKVGTGDSQTTYTRYAQNAHSAMSLSGGMTGGGFFTYGSFTFMPQVSFDGLFLRENGYAEFNPADSTTDADGFSLKVKSYDTKSARVFLGTNVRYDFDLWDVFMQPEVRAGYRYDFFDDPVTLKAAFKDLEPDTTGNQSGDWFSLTGPRSAQGSFVLGASLGASTGSWSLNLNYDFIRGTNSNIGQVATVNLIGRI